MIGKKNLLHGKQLHEIGINNDHRSFITSTEDLIINLFLYLRQNNKDAKTANTAPRTSADDDDWENASASWEAQIQSYVHIYK